MRLNTLGDFEEMLTAAPLLYEALPGFECAISIACQGPCPCGDPQQTLAKLRCSAACWPGCMLAMLHSAFILRTLSTGDAHIIFTLCRMLRAAVGSTYWKPPYFLSIIFFLLVLLRRSLLPRHRLKQRPSSIASEIHDGSTRRRLEPCFLQLPAQRHFRTPTKWAASARKDRHHARGLRQRSDHDPGGSSADSRRSEVGRRIG